MIVKKHVDRYGRVVLAVCDSSIKGKCFREKGLQLDLSSEFYNGEEKDEKHIAQMFKEAYIINLVGEEAIKLGIKEGIISENNIIRICKVPHAQVIVAGQE